MHALTKLVIGQNVVDGIGVFDKICQTVKILSKGKSGDILLSLLTN